MISDERLAEIAESGDPWLEEAQDIAKELLALRKAFSKPVATFTHCTATGRDVWIQTNGGEPLYRGPELKPTN